MRSKQKLTSTKSIINIILYGSAFVTLIFWTTFSDPFGPIKLIAILAISFWALGHLVIDHKKLINNKDLRLTFILLVLFILTLFISTLISSVVEIAWLGDYQRNNGFLFYFGLSVILIATAFYFKEADIGKFSNIAFILSLIISVYGLLQINGIDFVNWKNPYNAIISTVGNPNFAGAILATMGVLCLGFAIMSIKSKIRFVMFLTLVLLLTLTIFLSEARQGLIGIALGSSFIFVVFVHSRSRFLGIILFFVFSVVGIVAIFGMLQIGPLSQILYKGSVTVRGYYWRAGIEMFLAHPWFGVGTDYYGGYFKQFREGGYPLNYGFDITSTNAHNVFIQIFSTNGLFAGTCYFTLTLYIFWRGLRGIRRLSLEKRVPLSTILGAWLTLQAISVISIDSPGVAIWSWVLAGIIIALSSESYVIEINNQRSYPRNTSSGSSANQVLLSSILLVPVLFLATNMFKVESGVFNARQAYNPNIQKNGEYLVSFIPKLSQNSFINTIQITELASMLATSGYAKEGVELLNYAISKDERNLEAINLLANYYSELQQPEKAIPLRLRITELDQYNAKNYLVLGLIYKSLGDYTNMDKMKNIILGFAKNTPEGARALNELVL